MLVWDWVRVSTVELGLGLVSWELRSLSGIRICLVGVVGLSGGGVGRSLD